MLPDGAPPADYNKLLYTENDTKDMQRMGRLPQLRRTFRQFSTVSLVCVLVGTWEAEFIANTQGLIDGGLAGLFWSYIWTTVGFGMIAASLAEMASVAPTDGGMYHWVSEFAPPKYEKFLSYMTGWMSTLAWQAGNASGAFIAGTLIQAILVINDPSYEPKAWRATLLVFAAIVIVFVCNTLLVKFLPLIQSTMMVIHILLFITVIITFWVSPPHTSAKNVFTKFTNGGGWSSRGVSVMVGQITAIYALVGSDSAAHIAEETRDAGLVVAQAVSWSFFISAGMGLIFLVTMLFTITSIDDALSDPSGYPAVWMLRQSFPSSRAGVDIIICVILAFEIAANNSATITSSRQLFAFARDNGLPFSSWIAHVNPRLLIPLNAVILTCFISVILACINIGSNIAFNALASLFLVALMGTYMLSISCVLLRKYTSMKGSSSSAFSARWLMPRRIGIVVNILAVLYSAFAFFWCFWPNSTSHAVADLNWAPIIFSAVLLLALAMYFLQGRRTYVSPVSKVIHRGL